MAHIEYFLNQMKTDIEKKDIFLVPTPPVQL